MNNTWVKLYRKSNDKGLMKDHLAWILFSWILINVDKKTGSMKIGKYKVYDELGINPSTYYKVLHRLTNKWEVIKVSVVQSWSTVWVINWLQYQQMKNDEGTEEVQSVYRAGNESTPIQEYTRIQEYKNIESITQDVIELIASDYQVPIPFVRSKLEDIEAYCSSTGKKYKDYKATLRLWVKKDAFKLRKEVQYESRRVAIGEIPS